MNLIGDAYGFLRKKTPNDLRIAADFRSAKLELLSSTTLSDGEKSLLKSVSLQIHPGDGMYTGDGANAQHYLLVGLSAIRCIEDALEKSSRKNNIHSVLDFPSGYGRVLRF